MYQHNILDDNHIGTDHQGLAVAAAVAEVAAPPGIAALAPFVAFLHPVSSAGPTEEPAFEGASAEPWLDRST